MSTYKIKSDVTFSGLNTFIIDHHEQLQVNERITLTPKGVMQIKGENGGFVTLTPGVSFTGTVIEIL